MTTTSKIVVILGVAIAVTLVLALKQSNSAGVQPATAQLPDPMPGPMADPSPQLPRFVEVGADSCIPCKMMKPVLEELRSDYAGRLSIEFADVWESPELGDKYGVQTIPTQVIYDASGTEVFRHIGFWAKEEIDAKLTELALFD